MGLDVTEEEHDATYQQHLGPTGQLRFLHYLPLEVSQQMSVETSRLPAHTDFR